MTAHLEHANYTVSDPLKTAAWMEKLFGWHIRWQGAALGGGFTVHVGSDLALYTPAQPLDAKTSSYSIIGGLNHIAVVVQDLDACETAIKSHGFKTGNHGDYEPGRRFYFHDDDGIEYEVVQYS
jgi:catechol 2,3-dioxygenase-like lactoylglutathione lyase family enzyme